MKKPRRGTGLRDAPIEYQIGCTARGRHAVKENKVPGWGCVALWAFTTFELFASGDFPPPSPPAEKAAAGQD
jgi:hypothetical protein